VTAPESIVLDEASRRATGMPGTAKARMASRMGELLRFCKYLPNSYRAHVLELQRRFHGNEDDSKVLYFSRNQYLYAPNDVTAFRTWQTFFAASESAAEVAQFLRLRDGCNCFLDIGAAQGLFSAIFARTATTAARIVAVEPTDCYARLLRETLSANSGPDLSWRAEQVAILDQCETTALDNRAFDGFFSNEPDLVDPTQDIEVTTLDRLCERLEFSPDLIKLDVDGFEYEILLGSPDFFRRHRAKLHLELHVGELTRRGRDVDRLLDHMLRTHRIVASVPKAYRSADVARLSLVPK
jgi:FkbM family methyltransferase